MVITISSTLGKLMQNTLSAAFCLPSESRQWYQRLQFSTALVPHQTHWAPLGVQPSSRPQACPDTLAKEISACRGWLCMHIPPGMEAVQGQGVYPGTRVEGSICPAVQICLQGILPQKGVWNCKCSACRAGLSAAALKLVASSSQAANAVFTAGSGVMRLCKIFPQLTEPSRIASMRNSDTVRS